MVGGGQLFYHTRKKNKKHINFKNIIHVKKKETDQILNKTCFS